MKKQNVFYKKHDNHLFLSVQSSRSVGTISPLVRGAIPSG